VQGIYGKLRQPMDVKVIDLSRTGLGLETSTKMTVGERYVLELFHRGRLISVECDVRWCTFRGAYRTPAGAEVQLYAAGCALLDIDAARGAGLWERVGPPLPGEPTYH